MKEVFDLTETPGDGGGAEDGEAGDIDQEQIDLAGADTGAE